MLWLRKCTLFMTFHCWLACRCIGVIEVSVWCDPRPLAVGRAVGLELRLVAFEALPGQHTGARQETSNGNGSRHERSLLTRAGGRGGLDVDGERFGARFLTRWAGNIGDPVLGGGPIC